MTFSVVLFFHALVLFLRCGLKTWRRFPYNVPKVWQLLFFDCFQKNLALLQFISSTHSFFFCFQSTRPWIPFHFKSTAVLFKLFAPHRRISQPYIATGQTSAFHGSIFVSTLTWWLYTVNQLYLVTDEYVIESLVLFGWFATRGRRVQQPPQTPAIDTAEHSQSQSQTV